MKYAKQKMSSVGAEFSVKRGGNDCIVRLPPPITLITKCTHKKLNIMISFYSVFDILDLVLVLSVLEGEQEI